MSASPTKLFHFVSTDININSVVLSTMTLRNCWRKSRYISANLPSIDLRKSSTNHSSMFLRGLPNLADSLEHYSSTQKVAPTYFHYCSFFVSASSICHVLRYIFSSLDLGSVSFLTVYQREKMKYTNGRRPPSKKIWPPIGRNFKKNWNTGPCTISALLAYQNPYLITMKSWYKPVGNNTKSEPIRRSSHTSKPVFPKEINKNQYLPFNLAPATRLTVTRRYLVLWKYEKIATIFDYSS